ncbi:DnaJ domain [Pseudocohnilembus persalinus]|uniref:DnaJ domain n=1 Tax=Pseudocohnilembus persalinus TaxID=266149 RepID=A0A0V0QSM0_PSEPJ|nr:DnaJ domain [Pseudocohnilembus persalinus]|eukprot:KRX05185.1 DnaJ domain [Pseudocohnilembus persalinus]
MGAGCCVQDSKGNKKKQAQYKNQNDYQNDRQYIREQQKEYERIQKQNQKKHNAQKFQGQGIQLGGTGHEEQDDPYIQRQKALEAAEKRQQQGNYRGISKDGQADYELRKKKYEMAEQYKNQNNGRENYLREAWKKKQICHPDRNQNSINSCEDMYPQYVWAYEILSDPQRKEDYDLYGITKQDTNKIFERQNYQYEKNQRYQGMDNSQNNEEFDKEAYKKEYREQYRKQREKEKKEEEKKKEQLKQQEKIEEEKREEERKKKQEEEEELFRQKQEYEQYLKKMANEELKKLQEKQEETQNINTTIYSYIGIGIVIFIVIITTFIYFLFDMFNQENKLSISERQQKHENEFEQLKIKTNQTAQNITKNQKKYEYQLEDKIDQKLDDYKKQSDIEFSSISERQQKHETEFEQLKIETNQTTQNITENQKKFKDELELKNQRFFSNWQNEADKTSKYILEQQITNQSIQKKINSINEGFQNLVKNGPGWFQADLSIQFFFEKPVFLDPPKNECANKTIICFIYY